MKAALALMAAAALLPSLLHPVDAAGKKYFIDHLTEMRECLDIDPTCLDDMPPDVRHMIKTLPVLYAINVWTVAGMSALGFWIILYVTGLYFKKIGEPGLLSPAFFEQTVKADNDCSQSDGCSHKEAVLEKQADCQVHELGRNGS